MKLKNLYTGETSTAALSSEFATNWTDAIEKQRYRSVMISVLPSAYPAAIKVYVRQLKPDGTVVWGKHWDGDVTIAESPGNGIWTHLPYTLGTQVDGIVVFAGVSGSVLIESVDL